ncbi:MAG: methyltransferase domain-containing protein [bacterium]|nr:methyltransferase domain-containing protein [bacterium]
MTRLRGDSPTRCPSCAGARLRTIYQIDNIPVQSCILLDTEEEARAFPRHAIDLAYCENCGFIFNAAFDEKLVDYASATEESQHFSGTFGRFASGLVGEIAEHYDLADREVLEIGCGKGDFLKELCTRTRARGVGIDPGFLANRVGSDDVTFVRDYFRPEMVATTPDFVVCRHTLEHIAPVADFVEDVGRVVNGRDDVTVFFETPDAKRVLAEGAFWDIYFEHCSYFTMGSHARLFRQAGMAATRLNLAYDNQYIIQYADPADERTTPLQDEDDREEVDCLVASFPDRVASAKNHWRDFVRDRYRDGQRIAVWGGGSKAVSFLTTLGLNGEVATVIDINPFKQQKYLPISGHQVVAPEAITDDPPDCVIVMNPIYLQEIGDALGAMNLRPEITAV